MWSISERQSVSQISFPMISTVIEIPTFAVILGNKALFPGGLPSVSWLPEQNDTSPLPMTPEDYISSD